MTPREERGLVIAATQKLTQKGKAWLVPSQSGRGKYTVVPDDQEPYCSCPDFEATGQPCKHIHAVTFTVQREHAADGTVTETKSITFTQKQTYKQNWPVYDLAQMTEKRRFLELLADLCKGIQEPPAPKGRKPNPLADMIFSAVFKIYSTVSLRRFGTDLAEATVKGYLSKTIHPVKIGSFLENEKLTPVLVSLITASSLPLRVIESDFAVDSTGFSTSQFVRWFDQKYGVVRIEHEWVKAHFVCGVKTHVITAVRILDKDAADCPQFGPMVKETAENFKIGEVSADKAYLSAENIETVFQAGGTPYIAFKDNTTGKVGGLFEKMFHYYSLNKEEYMAHYHKRSNVESAVSMVKAKFRDNVRSKTDTAMKNEVLCKILAHNICCLIMSHLELGIEPIFWAEEKASQTALTQAV